MTDEKESLVDAWVAKYEPTYPIVILKSSAVEDAIGVRFFPTAAVVDPDGYLTYAGSAGAVSSPLSGALKKATKEPLFPKMLDKARALLRKDELAKSYAEVVELIESGEAEGDADAERFVTAFRGMVEGRAAAMLTKAQAFEKEGVFYRALAEVEPLVDAPTPFPCTQDATALMQRLEGLDNIKDELSGGKGYQKALELELEGEYADAVKAYCKVYRSKSLDGTKIAGAAEARARELVSAGKPGYRSTCSPCRKAKRACEKHKESIKL